MKEYKLVLQDSLSPLGYHWVAIDIETNEVIGKSFGKWCVRKQAESKGYILKSQQIYAGVDKGNGTTV